MQCFYIRIVSTMLQKEVDFFKMVILALLHQTMEHWVTIFWHSHPKNMLLDAHINTKIYVIFSPKRSPGKLYTLLKNCKFYWIKLWKQIVLQFQECCLIDQRFYVLLFNLIRPPQNGTKPLQALESFCDWNGFELSVKTTNRTRKK